MSIPRTIPTILVRHPIPVRAAATAHIYNRTFHSISLIVVFRYRRFQFLPAQRLSELNAIRMLSLCVFGLDVEFIHLKLL